MSADQTAHWTSGATEWTALPDRATWQAQADSIVAQIRRATETGLLQFPFPVPLQGECGCCGGPTPMPLSGRHARIQPDGSIAFAFSEAAVCQGCKMNSRMRLAMEVLRAHLAGRPGARVYLTEQTTALFRWLTAQGVDCRGSEWLGADKVPGSVHDGIEHQDIHRLTHPDAAFDAVVCLDVLEHVPDPVGAARELVRVLAPGGRAILTFPFFPDRDSTVTRSAIGADGTVQHLLPAQYHGNPLGGGSLVVSELAWDFIAALQGIAGCQAEFLGYWSLYRRHFGANRFVLLLTRDGAGAQGGQT